MFKKGRKREAKGLAVVYFIIGMLILLIILAVIYFALVELDWSDRIKDPDATMRSYVEMTPDPAAFELADDGLEGDGDSALDVDLTVPTDTPKPTATPTPTPSPTPEPTPSPTSLPATMLAQPRTSGFSLPAASKGDIKAGITRCVVSVGDENKVMYLAGYGYLNDNTFDGAQTQSFLVVRQSKTNQMIAYQMAMRAGISGETHDGALCKNAGNADFEVAFDVSQLYTEDIYELGLVIGYKRQGHRKTSYLYYPFPSDVSFTVLAGQVVEPVKVAGDDAAAVQTESAPLTAGADAAAAPTFIPANNVGTLTEAGTIDTGFDTSEPEDLEPENTFAPPAATQQPTIDNAQDTDISAVQEQIYANQMGIG